MADKEQNSGFHQLIPDGISRQRVGADHSDPMAFANVMLRDSIDETELTDRFHHFVVQACPVLGARAQVQPLDDIGIDRGERP